MRFEVVEVQRHVIRSGAEVQHLVLGEVAGSLGTAAAFQVRGSSDHHPRDLAQAPRNQRRVPKAAGADTEVEALLDEVQSARRREQLDADFGIELPLAAPE